MRVGACILMAVLMTGCVSSQPAPKPMLNHSLRVAQRSGNAAALAFDPPVASDMDPLDLSRDGRREEAFMGYDSLTAEYYWLHTDDRQVDYWDGRGDRFERRAVSTRVGVRYR